MAEKLARCLKETAARLGISRRSLYREMDAERLRAVKIGGRTMILAADEADYLASLPQVKRTNKATRA